MQPDTRNVPRWRGHWRLTKIEQGSSLRAIEGSLRSRMELPGRLFCKLPTHVGIRDNGTGSRFTMNGAFDGTLISVLPK